MFRISRFQQLMQHVPRGTFQSIIQRHGADRYTKGFGCQALLTAQVFGQLSDSRSLRELEVGYNAHPGQHYHLGTGPIARTTLADACARRTPAVFEELAQVLMKTARRKVRRDLSQGLLLLDSTSFTLKGRGFDWAQAERTRNTQGLKLHLVYDLGSATPLAQQITAANVNDITPAQAMSLRKGATYVFDKGYCDYHWWARFAEHDARFITRLKRDAKVERVKDNGVAQADQEQIVCDELVRLSNRHPGGKRRNQYTDPIRRITVRREDKDTDLVLVTNDLTRSAAEVAACYKARWQIELFFKWIKQNLRIRTFYGRSQNAVRIQILCALIAHLLVALYRQANAASTSMLRVLGELRVGLFQRPAAEEAIHRRRSRRLKEVTAIQVGLFP